MDTLRFKKQKENECLNHAKHFQWIYVVIKYRYITSSVVKQKQAGGTQTVSRTDSQVASDWQVTEYICLNSWLKLHGYHSF